MDSKEALELGFLLVRGRGRFGFLGFGLWGGSGWRVGDKTVGMGGGFITLSLLGESPPSLWCFVKEIGRTGKHVHNIHVDTLGLDAGLIVQGCFWRRTFHNCLNIEEVHSDGCKVGDDVLGGHKDTVEDVVRTCCMGSKPGLGFLTTKVLR